MPAHADRLNPTSRPPRKTRYVAVMSGRLAPVACLRAYLVTTGLSESFKSARNRTALLLATPRAGARRAVPPADR